MSTLFGVKIDKELCGIDPEGWRHTEEDRPATEEYDKEIVEIAFRSDKSYFVNLLAYLLPDNTPVIPLDNSAQGIYTIGDIRKVIESQREEEKKVKLLSFSKACKALLNGKAKEIKHTDWTDVEQCLYLYDNRLVFIDDDSDISCTHPKQFTEKKWIIVK